MALKHVQFLVLAGFLTIASCSSVYNPVQIIETNENDLMQRISTADVQISKDDFRYTIPNKKNVPCMLANMDIKISVPYKTENETKNAILTVDKKPTGTCSDVKSEMVFTWREDKDEKSKDNVVTFTFINDHTDFSLFSITAYIYMDSVNFAGSIEKNKDMTLFSGNDLRLFAASAKNGLHKCDKEITQKVETAEFTISKVSLIAFNKDNDLSTRKEEQCSDKTKDTKTFRYSLVDDDTKVTCTLAKMDISLTIPYSTKASEVKHGIISVKDSATAKGSCGTTQSYMNITWSESSKEQTFAADSTENFITFSFVKNKGSTYVNGISFGVYADNKNFPDAAETRLSGQTPLIFQELITPENGLYSCANKTIDIKNAVMNISNLLFIAFDAQKDLAGKPAVDCKSELSPSEKDFKYTVKNSNNVSCILANMDITMKVPYEQKDNKNGTGTITLPSAATATGTCDHLMSTLNLEWPSDIATRSIKFYFSRNSSTFFLQQAEAYITLKEDKFPGAIHQNQVVHSMTTSFENLFAADANNGLYKCTEQHHTVSMTDGVEMDITNVALIAFNEDDDLSTRETQSCSKEPDISSSSSSSSTTSTTSLEPPTEPPTEPPAPAPEPDPSVKKFVYYVVNEGSDVACLLANMTVSLQITYDKADSGTNTKTLTVPPSPTTKVGGTCDKATSTMKLTWQEKTDATFDTTDTQNVVTLTFQKDKSTFSLHSISVSLYLDEKNFPDAKLVKKRAEANAKDANVFTASADKLYKCAPKTTAKVGSVDVAISDLILIAFNSDKKVPTRTVEECAPEESESDVGAIVGGIIGGLILLGLLVYGFIWYRRRRMP